MWCLSFDSLNSSVHEWKNYLLVTWTVAVYWVGRYSPFRTICSLLLAFIDACILTYFLCDLRVSPFVLNALIFCLVNFPKLSDLMRLTLVLRYFPRINSSFDIFIKHELPHEQLSCYEEILMTGTGSSISHELNKIVAVLCWLSH